MIMAKPIRSKRGIS